MKKIIALILISLIFLLSVPAHAADRRSNPYKSKQIYERRQRIQQSGDVNRFYKQPVRIDWVFINGRARMALFFNR